MYPRLNACVRVCVCASRVPCVRVVNLGVLVAFKTNGRSWFDG